MGNTSCYSYGRSIQIISFLLISFILIAIPCTYVSAEGIPLKNRFEASGGKFVESPDVFKLLSYATVRKEYEKQGYKPAEQDITVDVVNNIASDMQSAIQSGIGGKNTPVVVSNSSTELCEWSFTANQKGLYNVFVEYFIVEENFSNVEREFLIDGKLLFREAGNVRFPRRYADASEPITNSLGNEVRPKQKEIKGWYETGITDNQGLASSPFEIYLEEGKHTIGFKYINGSVAISKIILKAPEVLKDYAEIKKQYESNGYENATKDVKIQAESTVLYKSEPVIRRENNGDPMVEPAAYDKLKLNIIGDYNWRSGNQTIVWEFDTEEDGLYKIALRTAQWWGDGMPSHRQIRVNGKVPFKEMEEYPFHYDRRWRTETLEDPSGEPYLFYLKKGRNTLSMTVKIGPTGEIIEQLNESSLMLSRLIRKIIMITGNNPDLNYDYELNKSIPGLVESFHEITDKLQDCADKMQELSIKMPAAAYNLKAVRTQLLKMAAKPDIIPKSFDELNNALSSFGGLAQGLQQQPLSLDYIVIAAPESKVRDYKSSVLSKLWATLVNFMSSFFKDYDNVGTTLDAGYDVDTTINVWVTRGKEWGELLKEIADEDFTPKTGIEVKINIMPQAAASTGSVNPLMLAINSGKAPDVVMGSSSGTPVEYAFRGAVADITKFEDFKEVASRFVPEMLIPYGIDDKVYALPETTNFRVMYYRKDILNELGIRLPDTWEELYSKVLPILYQNGMQFYFPANFDVFLYQKNGQYFRNKGRASALDTPEAFQAFKELCELYYSYGVPVAADFFNRFRTGEMPIGIGDFSFYTYVSAAAPELNGLWGISQIVGHKGEDGKINRTVGSVSIDATFITDQSKKQQEAWEFLKWWSDAETQKNYSRQIESRIGIQARWTSANVDAFLNLPWKSGERDIIKEQQKWIKETPIYLGSYFSGRHVGNAWNRVVIGGDEARGSLEQAVKDINKELKRKQEQYGLLGDADVGAVN